MTLLRFPFRSLVACLFLAACADEAGNDALNPDDEALDPSTEPATDTASQALVQVPRNVHCRHGHGCTIVDASRPQPSDAGTPASGCRLADGAACAPASDASVPQFTVTGVAGKGGSAVASSPTGTCTNAGVNWSCTVPKGGSVAVAAKPADTWKVLSWSCPQGVAGGEVASIANVQADSDCFVSFVPITFAVSYQAVDFTGAPLPGVVTAFDAARGPCTDDVCGAQQGDTVVLTAGSSAGLTFVGWSGCSDSKAATLSFVVNADQACVAHYEPPVVLL